MTVTPHTPSRVVLPEGARWAACSAREFGPIGEVAHIVRRGALTTTCGASATYASIWRTDSRKPWCAQCVAIAANGGKP